MRVEKKPGRKMKIAGYICLSFCIPLTIAVITGGITLEEGKFLIPFWGTLGTTLLFGTATKRIVGSNLIAKQAG